MRQNDIEKIIAYQKCFIGPLVWKCFTNNFELLLSEKEFPTFCTFFMYINVHGHQIFAKCTLNECTKMELDPPLILSLTIFPIFRARTSVLHCLTLLHKTFLRSVVMVTLLTTPSLPPSCITRYGIAIENFSNCYLIVFLIMYF